jgi:hypothetical protein
LIITASCYAESGKRVVVVGGQFSIIIPEGISYFDDPNDFSNDIRNNPQSGKFRMTAGIDTFKEISEAHPSVKSPAVRDLLKNKGKIVTREDLLELFKKTDDFVLSSGFPMSAIRESYRRIVRSDGLIIEEHLAGGGDGMYAPRGFSLHAHFLVDAGIAFIYLNFQDVKYDIHMKMPHYFVKETKNNNEDWYYRSPSARTAFGRAVMAKESGLPPELRKMGEDWEKIVESIEVPAGK